MGDIDLGTTLFCSCQVKMKVSHAVVGMFSIVLVILTLSLSFGLADDSATGRNAGGSIVDSGGGSESVLGNYSQAAVAIDGAPCATVGKEILEEGGTAVDAAVAAMVCNGVYNPQSTGLGGGFLMTIFTKDR